jgi:acylphosphatase
MKCTYTITVVGNVQGVFYRQSTREKARELDITGTVENLPDGNVSIIATGNKDDLEALIEWCKKGPEKADVDHLIIGEVDLHLFDQFEIKRR